MTNPTPVQLDRAALKLAQDQSRGMSFDALTRDEHNQLVKIALETYLSATPASPSATGVRVKKLAWTDEGNGLSRAKTPFGFSYWANHRTCMWLGREDDWAVAEGDPSDSAQDDYDALVLSALVEQP